MISVAQIHGSYVTYAWAFPSAAPRGGAARGASQRGVRAAPASAVRAATRVIRPGALLRDDLFWVRGTLLLQVGGLRPAGHSAAAVAAGAGGGRLDAQRLRARDDWDDPRVAERVARAYAAPDLAAVRERQVDLLGPEPGWRIADIGCGPGAFAEALCARGARVTAIDSGARDARRRRGPRARLRARRGRCARPAARERVARRRVPRPGARVRRRSGRGTARGGAGRAPGRRRARGRHRLGHAGLQRRRSRARAPRRAGLGRRQAGRLGGPAAARLARRRPASSPRSAAPSCSMRRSGAATRSSRTTGRRSGAALERRAAFRPPISLASRPRSRTRPRAARSTGASCATRGAHACRADACYSRGEHLVEEGRDDLDRLVRALEQVGVADVRELLTSRARPGLSSAIWRAEKPDFASTGGQSMS